MQVDQKRNACTLVGLLMLTLLSGACTRQHQITAPATFPKPALEVIPLTAGLYASSEFQQYVHKEEITPGDHWDLKLGPASTRLFQTILGASFRQLRMLSEAPASKRPTSVQIAFTPTLEDFQFSTGRQAGAEFIEAWVKYSVQVHDREGNALTAWSIAAYGRHRGQLIGGLEEGLGLAIQEAMRDAGAALALKLRSVRKRPARGTRTSSAAKQSEQAPAPDDEGSADAAQEEKQW